MQGGLSARGVLSAPPAGRPFYSQRIRALPQVRPPPNTGRQIRSCGLMLPSRTASSRAIAQESYDMLPYL